MAAGTGVAFGSAILPDIVLGAATSKGAPKRVIFFLQNQGFDPMTCVPEGLEEDVSLAGVSLPEPISPLEPYKEKIHIINGLHGRHTSPGHSAFFGALGGYSSNNAEKQHSSGQNWPFILLGDCSGRIKTGQFTQIDGKRPINALYTTLLHAVGTPSDRFNMDKNMAGMHDAKIGPIEELLA